MTVSDSYKSQVELLLRCLPAVSEGPNFAPKGGTTINPRTGSQTSRSDEIALAASNT